MPVASPFEPSGGGTVNLEHEDVSSQVDGSTQTFTVSSAYQVGTLQVYWNGLLQLSSDIAESSQTTFTTSFTPSSDDNLVVIYIER
jgi:hypothetical protein